MPINAQDQQNSDDKTDSEGPGNDLVGDSDKVNNRLLPTIIIGVVIIIIALLIIFYFRKKR
jgi:subtilase family serine protease